MSYALNIVDKALGSAHRTTAVFPCRISAMQYAGRHYSQKEPLAWISEPDGSLTSETDLLSFRVEKSSKRPSQCTGCLIKNSQLPLTISKRSV